MDFSAVILAGGQSQRMGRDKAWVEVRGETLLSRAVATVWRSGAREIFISGRKGEVYPAARCPVLHDLTPGRGPLGGIERALSEATSPLVLVLAVDMPRMTAKLLRTLLSRCSADTGIVPQCAGRLEPLAAIYPKRCHALAVAALAKKHLAARSFAEACLQAGAVKIYAVPVVDRLRFTNWNAPEDLPHGAGSCLRPG